MKNICTENLQKKLNGRATRVMLVGDYTWPWYQDACADALEYHGCIVERFGWFDDFRHWKDGQSEPVYNSFLHRIQFRLRSGPTVWQVNKRLIRKAKKFKPEIIWFYNVQLIAASVVSKLRLLLPDTIFVQYANDNPFSNKAKPGIWRNFLKSIPFFDVHFAYRHDNILDYRKYGAKNVHLFRAYFIPEVDYPVPLENIPQKFKCDVVFAGHYEDDGRIEMLEAICNAGYKLNLFGGGWDSALTKLSVSSPLHAFYPIKPVTKADYRHAISGAKVALCFLSTLNQDTYTRRNFQIPAMKTAMLCQYTDDLASLFKPDLEAVYFSSKVELLNKLKILIFDEHLRKSLAEAGYQRLHRDGHDAKSRTQILLNTVLTKIKPQRYFSNKK